MPIQVGTNLFANMLLPITLIQPTTAATQVEQLARMTRPLQARTSESLLKFADIIAPHTSVAIPIDFGAQFPTLEISTQDRPTTAREQLIGELRRLRLLEANWDGEGANAPIPTSLKQAVTFASLLDSNLLPEPMLHASGHAGLFWKSDTVYADLEFLGDDRVAYFVERGGDKHKGVLTYIAGAMPPVLAALLQD